MERSFSAVGIPRRHLTLSPSMCSWGLPEDHTHDPFRGGFQTQREAPCCAFARVFPNLNDQNFLAMPWSKGSIFITQVFISDITLSWNRWSSIYYLYSCILFNSLPLVAFSLHGWPHFFPVQWYQITSGQCHCQPSLWPMYWSKDKYLIISLQRAAVQFLNYGHSPYNEKVILFFFQQCRQAVSCI